ncbi:hypothetical protein LV716_17345 [Flagellimonas sp. HMM57]|uniref:hypothetical protein n=1 Tax=unclassified Flagellimonas TaxID=2644544 RepID=UPI0013D731CB|nr:MULTISPECIES: hypothetical protein [unclassified Flagellimonas]UII76008.1 hypothetical protein LV716_17345 [Flagellimonas sp. HMM57]
MRIGSVLFNPFTKQITGFVEIEKVYSEATLKPEIVSRWLSPDPLTEEREWLTPYNFVQNDPINRIDPDGALDEMIQQPDDRYKLLSDGTVEYFDNKGGESIDYLMDESGNEIQLTDTSILPQLESQTMQESAHYSDDVILTGNYAISKNNKQTKKLFDWVASRDSNEWAYIKGKTDGGVYSFIGSYHVSDQAPSPRRAGGFGDFETLINIHSHYGTSLDDFQPSGSDMAGARRERMRSPNAQFFIFSPLITKNRYNNAIDGKILPGTLNTPYKKIDYEPKKYIPY